MKPTEQVAIATALQKGVKQATDVAREQIAATMEPGDRKTLYIGDTKVGTATMTEAKPKVSVRISNAFDFMNWCIENQYIPTISISSNEISSKHYFQRIEDNRIITRDGEVVPGVTAWYEEPTSVLQVRPTIPECTDRDGWPQWVIGLCTDEQLLEAITIPALLEGGVE